MDEVLVVKAIQPNYNTVSGGPPIMMVGGGGRSRDGPAVGRTKREMAGGFAGGLVGVAGALAGQHRSLGSLVQGMISGGAQGKALGSALGRSRLVGVGRQRQALADYDEEAKRDYARMGAEGRFDNRKYDVNDRMNPATMRRRVQEVNQEDEAAREQAKRDNAFEERRAGAAGFKTGTRQAKDAEMTAGLRDHFMSQKDADGKGRTEQDFDSRYNEYMQAQPMQRGTVRVERPPQSVDPTQGVTRADGSVVPPQSLVGISNSIAPLGENSAANEISSLENAGDQFNQNRTNQALTYKPPQEDEDEEGEGEEGPTLDDIQQQQRTAVVNSMRPNSLDDIQQRNREQQGM